ncbi:MAG: hypothetical protein KKB38_20800 [Gammaproteobacteria bacterium]|nr:hypothetical protein [Gammaproteobacteria bacterium]
MVKCNPVKPPVAGGKELLQRLLDIELARLDIAVKIEKERKIVFPETSIIVHDIQRLQRAVDGTSDNDMFQFEELNVGS